MIGESFFTSINLKKPKYLFTMSYIYYSLAKKIYSSENITNESLYDWFSTSYYSNGGVRKSEFNKQTEQWFKSKSNNEFSLYKNQIKAIENIKYIKKICDVIKNEEFLIELRKLNDLGFIEFDEKLLYMFLMLENEEEYISKDMVDSYYFLISSHCNDYYLKLDYFITETLVQQKRSSLKAIILYDNVIEKLSELGVSTVEDLQLVSPNLLIILLNYRLPNFIDYIDNKLLIIEIETILEDIFTLIDENEIYILSQRFKGLLEDLKTLEELGRDLNLTRERVRQIERKMNGVLTLQADKYRSSLENYFYFLLNKYDADFIDIETIERELPEHNIFYILAIALIPSTNITFDEHYRVLFLKNVSNIKYETTKIFNMLDDTILNDNQSRVIESFSESVRGVVGRVVKENYKLYENTLIKKNIKISDLALKTIDLLFPNGFRPNSDEDFNILLNYFDLNYADFSEKLNKRAVGGYLERKNYCLVDKGTYLNRRYCNKIPEDLLSEIIKYINSYSKSIYYATLFAEYKDQLKKYGIYNRFYFKGVLDDEIKEFYHTKRDYIGITTNSSPREEIRKKIYSYQGKFSYDDLRQTYKGIRENVIYNLLYEIENLVWLSNRNFILLSNLNIEQDTLDFIINECNNLFNILHTEYISSAKLYARLKLLHPKVLIELKVVNNQYDLFSVLKILLKNTFYFRRPIISSKANIDNQYEIILNYAYNLKKITKEDIDDFTSKMNFTGLYSYLDFIEAVSDKYVQINQDALLSKEYFNILNTKLLIIKDVLNMLFAKNKTFSTSDFKGYYLFPKIGFKWNQYLLAGIIRSYLDNSFIVENTESTYNTTNYIVRRVENE